MENSRLESSEVNRLRAEMAEQEAQWKEAYDVLMAENNVLKSSGSEAMLASQWRQRYDTVLKEKEDIENKLKMELQKNESSDSGKYEMKYRDLKESFRLYRKKAKEIFEAQQSGEHGVSKQWTKNCQARFIFNASHKLIRFAHVLALFDSCYNSRVSLAKMQSFRI